MITIKKTAVALTAAGAMMSAAWASEVYIEQVGSTININVTQTGTTNIVSGALGTTNAALVRGNGINLDVTQTGDYNEASVKLDSATSADVDYTATGSNNIFDVYVNGGSSNITSVTVDGDSNRVVVCGTIASGVAGTSCNAGISANNITNTVGVTGNSNEVNIAVASIAGTTNTVNIGNNVTSNNNTVNITQTNIDVNIVDISVDGNTNVINIIQN
jgi:hypothetical protein